MGAVPLSGDDLAGFRAIGRAAFTMLLGRVHVFRLRERILARRCEELLCCPHSLLRWPPHADAVQCALHVSEIATLLR